MLPEMAINTSQRDPTRTTMLRAEYAKAMRSRFGAVRRLIVETVVDNDALALSASRDTGTLPVLLSAHAQAKQRYDFPSDLAGKSQMFMDWLMQASDEEILEISEYQGRRITGRNPWQNTFVRAGYGKGVQQATSRLRQAGAEIPDMSLVGILNMPMHTEVLALLFIRNFDEVKGVTDAMGSEIARSLAEGLSGGLGPRDVARLITDRVDKIGIIRATKIARTEIIRAHAEATLNRYEEFGVGEVGLLAEFVTAGDSKVCPICKDLAAKDIGYGKGIYKLSEARGMIPVHPNCRCAWIPVLGNLAANRRVIWMGYTRHDHIH